MANYVEDADGVVEWSPRSSAIARVRWEAATEELSVTFITGRTYSHPGVPRYVVAGFASALSPGSYYGSEIRGTY